uniref:Protein kinase domain-containing protein n=1 Tax=Clastoptera arizonana TaxID=38151 RepID=A0A1B6EAI1_9HEMI
MAKPLEVPMVKDFILQEKPKGPMTPKVKQPPRLERPCKMRSGTPSDAESEDLCSATTCVGNYFKEGFKVINDLGEGSFGKVYKAFSLEDNKTYAVKVEKRKLRGESIRLSKRDEVLFYDRVSNHPNIVKLFFAWEENETVHMQLELCDTNLQVMSRIIDISECYVWSVLVDITNALNYIHSFNYVHLDVKLDNILVGYDGRFKLGDFGLVHNLASAAGRYVEGDARYVAKEVLLDEPTTAADIFSLGISILELAAGVDLPIRGEKWHRLRRGEFPYLATKDLSDDLIKIIAWMMNQYCEKRPSAVTLLQDPVMIEKSKKRNWELKCRDGVSKVKDMICKLFAPINNVWISLSLLANNFAFWKQPRIKVDLASPGNMSNISSSSGASFSSSGSFRISSPSFGSSCGKRRTSRPLSKPQPFTSSIIKKKHQLR